MRSQAVYLDHNATTPLAPGLKPFIAEYLDLWGNPSSIHQHGRAPKAALREARRQVAECLGADPLEIIFTGSGSEANNLALKGMLKPLRFESEARNRILISPIEHPSVLKTAIALKNWGYEVDLIPVSRNGEVDLNIFEHSLTPQTALVSCMLANNETGVVLPVAEMVKRAHAKGILFHCDGVQALGKIPVNVRTLGADLMSFSGHKFYSLKGAGVLYARRGLALSSLVHGGGQERGRRAGTENILAIACLGEMCRHQERVVLEYPRLAALRDQMEARILALIPGVQVNGQGVERLPNTSSLVIAGVDGETLLMNLDMQGFSVSTGAACNSGSSEPSPALLAMGLSRAEAQSSLRVSLGWGTTDEQVQRFVDALENVVQHIRSFARERTVARCLTDH